jgi:hypothetical protein
MTGRMKTNRIRLVLIATSALIWTSCATNERTEPGIIDVSTMPKETRVAIMPVAWFQKDMEKAFPMQGDERLSYIMIATLGIYLNEQQVPAYFIGSTTGVLDTATLQTLQAFNIAMLITNAPPEAVSDGLRGLSEEFKDKAPRILIPAAVCEKDPWVARILSNPSGFKLAYHAYLIDTATGTVIWSHLIQRGGNYNTLCNDLRGPRWGRGAMWELIDTYPGASKPDNDS